MRPIILLLIFSSFTGCIGAKAGYWLVQSEKASSAANLVNAGQDESMYEFILGEEYRLKAWEEAGYSEYQAAEQFARDSIVHYNTAREMALYGHQTLDLFEQLEADEDFLPDLLAPEPETEESQPTPVDDLFAPEDDSDDVWGLDDLLGE